MAVRPHKISDIKPLFTNLAQTSHYKVEFAGLPIQLSKFLLNKGITPRFIGEDAGLLCFSASLPTSSFATANVTGSYTGITETFAHTRQYQQISLEFYVDNNYKTLIFLESWMEFIASGSFNPQGISNEHPSISQNQLNYFSRIQYPDFYKSNGTKIIKFERDYKRKIEYNFLGFYPTSLSSPSVSYSQSDTLKVSATFSYDRYISGKWFSINTDIGDNNNNNLTTPPPGSERRPPTVYQSAQSRQTEGVSVRTSS